MESRAAYFAKWCKGHQLEERRLQALTPQQGLTLIGHYLDVVAGGLNLQSRDNLSQDTICGYMRAAGNWLAVECKLQVPVFTTGGSQKQDQLNPYLSGILSQ